MEKKVKEGFWSQADAQPGKGARACQGSQEGKGRKL